MSIPEPVLMAAEDGPAAPRFIQAIPVLYRPSDQTEWLRGLTVDISESGILLEAVRALAPGSRLDLTFKASTSVLGSGRVVRNGTPTPAIPHPVGIQCISAEWPAGGADSEAVQQALEDLNN